MSEVDKSRRTIIIVCVLIDSTERELDQIAIETTRDYVGEERSIGFGSGVERLVRTAKNSGWHGGSS